MIADPTAEQGYSLDLDGRARLANTDLSRLRRRDPAYPLRIVRGEGAELIDAGGNRLLDAGHHLGACQVGHGRSEIAARIAAQAERLAFASLDNGFSHPLAAELAERLAGPTPAPDPVFLFTTSGSEAVEAAVKLARGHHARRGEPRRTKVIGRAGSYHGSSYAAMSAGGQPAWREPYAPLVGDFLHVGQPSPPRCGLCGAECSLACAEEVGRAIEREGPETVAAVIGEPIAIREAVKVPAPGYWPRLREICDRHGVLLIVDEVFVGFGRTGETFASDHWGLRADIVTMAKGITSGYVPFGAAAVAGEVYEPFRSEPLLHISTYAGHPVGCAAALASLDLLEGEELVANAAALGPLAAERGRELERTHERVMRSGGLGLLHSVEVAAAGADPAELAADLADGCRRRGVAVRAAAGADAATLFFFPPLVVDEADVERAYGVFDAAIAALP